MTDLHDAWLAKRRARFMRQDAHRWIRRDMDRFLRPEYPFRKWHRRPDVKGSFNPDQPRVPRGNPDGGRWTADGGAGSSRTDALDRGSSARRPGIGHNQGPPLETPPEIPKQTPPTTQERNTYIKAAAHWLARAVRLGIPIGAFMSAMEAVSWLDTDRAFIDAYLDAPKSFEDLQEAVSDRKLGYHVHHIVEQTPARMRGFSENLINGRDNLVRIPALKHWQITGWYGRPNPDFDGMSPREYLQDKDWDERMRVGHIALVKFEVLKP